MKRLSKGGERRTPLAGSGEASLPKLTYGEAVETVIERVRPLTEVTLPVVEARGKVLASPVYARWDLPTADNSAMDGYAFRFEGQRPGDVLPVIGISTAGAPFDGPVAAGEAVKIMTGGVMPPRCDSVVPKEDVDIVDEAIRLKANVEKGRHVRRRSEEIERGQVLAEPGDLLGPVETACLVAAGITSLTVRPSPLVALFSTGDELVEPGSVPGPGQIVNSNSLLLEGLLREEGCRVLPLGIVRDSREELEKTIVEALEADLVLSTGLEGQGQAGQAGPLRNAGGQSGLRPSRQPGLVGHHLRAFRASSPPETQGTGKGLPPPPARRPGEGRRGR
jgi:molybdopterin molybdotransferase